MGKRIVTMFLVFFLLSCSGSGREKTQVDPVYSMDDVAMMGVKIKGDFDTQFPEATDSKWGFYKGREVAVFRYPTAELARTLGKTAAEEQTELIEILEKNIAHGPNVEKTKCRGDNYGGTPYKLMPKYKSGFQDILILNKTNFMGDDIEIPNDGVRDGCVRREPMYIEFKIHGNLVILTEPMPEEDRPAMVEVLDGLIAKLP